MDAQTLAPAPVPASDMANPGVACIRDGLQTLDQAELQELDAIITPRAAELLVKAFGPDMWTILAPLVADDLPAEDSAADGDRAPENEDSLRDLMKNPRYWRDRHPETVRQVTEGFRSLYRGNR